MHAFASRSNHLSVFPSLLASLVTCFLLVIYEFFPFLLDVGLFFLGT
jgi:hypothetical protein